MYMYLQGPFQPLQGLCLCVPEKPVANVNGYCRFTEEEVETPTHNGGQVRGTRQILG